MACRDFNTPTGCKRTPCRFSHVLSPSLGDPGSTSTGKSKAPVPASKKKDKQKNPSPANPGVVSKENKPSAGNPSPQQSAPVSQSAKRKQRRKRVSAAKQITNAAVVPPQPAPTGASVPQAPKKKGGQGQGSPSKGSAAPQVKKAPQPPSDACFPFYKTGTCKLGDKCRYRHVKPEGTAATQGHPLISNQGSQPPPATEEAALTSVMALRNLEKLVSSKVPFVRPSQMVAFTKLLAAATTGKDDWDAEDRQWFLTKVTEAQGLEKIESILAYRSIASKSLAKDESISFISTYLGCLSYIVSDYVLDSTMTQRVNKFFGIIHTNYAHFHDTVTKCMQDIVTRRSFENSPHPLASGAAVFNTLIRVLVEYSIRIKGAFHEHDLLPALIESVSLWYKQWKSGKFVDGWNLENEHKKRITLTHLDFQMRRLFSIMHRELDAIARKEEPTTVDSDVSPEERHREQLVLASDLGIQYEPAGQLRRQGPRHDNDFDEIQEIEIPPSEGEMLCPVPPFLPLNIPGGPHHLPEGSMERLLDIQFRLLREELVASLRMAIQSIVADLQDPSRNTPLQPILNKRGGRYIAKTSRTDSTMVNLYTSVNPTGIVTDRRGLVIEVEMDSPPGTARSVSTGARIKYWEGVSRKRLMQSGLVCLLWQTNHRIELFFGLISSSVKDLLSSVKQSRDTLGLRIKFFDPAINLKVIEWRRLDERDRKNQHIFLIEAPVMYDSIRPFLQALQRESTSFPFAEYLVHRSEQSGQIQPMAVSRPKYTITRPEFKWDLSCLFEDLQPLQLDPANLDSIEESRHTLKASSRLDVSQADAVVDCLTKEFCLIQGPPGTGKSFTGVELIRVLLANKAGPILLIALTNHALDHLLVSVLKNGITRNIVRLGSRSADETISQFSLENLEKSDTEKKKPTGINGAFHARKEAERELDTVVKELQGGPISDADRDKYLEKHYPEHRKKLRGPPLWIKARLQEDAGWTKSGSRKKTEALSEYEFWITSSDNKWLERALAAQEDRRKVFADQSSTPDIETDDDADESTEDDSNDGYESSESEESNEDDAEVKNSSNIAALRKPKPESSAEKEERLLNEFLHLVGLTDLPPLPSSSRSLDELQRDSSVWFMSSEERARLDMSWTYSTRQLFFQRKKDSFAGLKETFEEAQTEYEECQAQAKLSILKTADIIGCTTTGAAKLTSLLNGIRPSILLVEEAGQVLEAHILGSLVQSIEHVIMIGDPLQLRPNINNYALSMEHPQGRDFYKFDQSAMERLGNTSMPMSQLTVQRRMRPQIASIARKTLYNHLQDNESVMAYPDVRGLAKNMFFFHHTHAEGGMDEETMSKFNIFEASMIIGLVKHLLRQGVYAESGKIVVLCMYLGQLARIRDGFRDSTIDVVLDSRDEEELRNREGDTESKESEVPVEIGKVKVTDQVLLRTVDNFQGEEADVVLLSLVRNPGEGKSGSIGFLKSSNRANVALTRARHGLYVFGNGEILAARSEMWEQVVQEFKDQNAYGTSLPIACYRHPDYVRWVQNDSELRDISPDGGCLRPCSYILKCGHACPLKCHADDEDHVFVKCHKPCRQACNKGHHCKKECWMECGSCEFLLPEITLHCGHVLRNAPCHLQDDQSTFRCREQVEKDLPYCEHAAIVDCCQDPADVQCTVTCAQIMACCQTPCQSYCGACQRQSSVPGIRETHCVHRCDQELHCGHFCQQSCESDHAAACGTTNCRSSCVQRCPHRICSHDCSEPCLPCDNPCPWICKHHTCPVSCGIPCVRLPCDARCENILLCNHPCPSLCGEPCEQQICTICDSSSYQFTVDKRSRTMADIDPKSTDLSNITITLRCRHVFTVQALDEHWELTTAYEWSADTQTWIRPLFSPRVSVDVLGCPICWAPVTALRYGRLTKCANLNLLERNIATKMARQLAEIQAAFNQISQEQKSTAVQKATEIVKPRHNFSISAKAANSSQELRSQLISTKSTSLLSVEYLGKQMKKVSGIPGADSKRWIAAIQPLLDLYQQSLELGSKYLDHSATYTKNLHLLYQSELDLADQDLATSKKEASARKAANIQIGMVPPRAGTRLQVEATRMSINIRLLIGDLAEKCFLRLASTETGADQFNAWYQFVVFIYQSCRHDAELAGGIALNSKAYRQEFLSTLGVLAARWKITQFKANMAQSLYHQLDADRRNLALVKANTKAEFKNMQNSVQNIRLYIESRNATQPDVIREEYDVPSQHYLRMLSELIESLNAPMVVPLKNDESYLIKTAFTEQHCRGYWYTCPDGHIFTVSDFPGVTLITRCNECGLDIEGGLPVGTEHSNSGSN